MVLPRETDAFRPIAAVFGQSEFVSHGERRQCWSDSKPDLAAKASYAASSSSLKWAEIGTCADSWHLNRPLGSAMGLKEVCAQWSAFVEAKTAWNLRHDCLRVDAARHYSIGAL